MTAWVAKVFWSEVAVRETEAGFAPELDGRPIRTPGKSPLILPTAALADLVAEEWRAQEQRIDPASMPATRMANSAIEKVAPQRTAVADHLAEYGETDLLCYRAGEPAALVVRQTGAWDPWLDWAEERFGARLRVTTGVVPIAQSEKALAALRGAIPHRDPFELAAFHDLVTIPGSLVLGLAVAEGAADARTLWPVARLDELYQIEHWGEDAEAERVAAAREAAFADAERFFRAAARG